MSLINWEAGICLLNQEAAASHSRGLQPCSAKGINTLPFTSLLLDCWAAQEKGAGPKRLVSLTRGCEPIQNLQKFRNLTGSFEKAPGLSKSNLI